MWIAHHAPGLLAHLLTPHIPLSFLALSGCLPDLLHLFINLLPSPLSIESFNFDEKIAGGRKGGGGCFPYSNDYRWTHSLAGMGVIGLATALLYPLLARSTNLRTPTLKDQFIIFLTVLTHFPLELPVHRADVKITPNSSHSLGSGLFASPTLTLLIELSIFFSSLFIWYHNAPRTSQRGARSTGAGPGAGAGGGRGKASNLLWGVSAFFAVQQIHFCYGSAPTSNSRYIHAPIFIFEILLSSYLLGLLEDPNPRQCCGVDLSQATRVDGKKIGENLKANLKAGAGKVGEGVEGVRKMVEDGMGRGVQGAKDGAGKVRDGVGDGVNKGMAGAKEGAGSAHRIVGDGVGNVQNSAQEGAARTQTTLGNGLDKAQNSAQGGAARTQEVVGDGMNKGAQGVQAGAGGLTNILGDANSKAVGLGRGEVEGIGRVDGVGSTLGLGGSGGAEGGGGGLGNTLGLGGGGGGGGGGGENGSGFAPREGISQKYDPFADGGKKAHPLDG